MVDPIWETAVTKNTYGYLGVEPGVLREQLEKLAATLETMVNAESKEALNSADEAARGLLAKARALADKIDVDHAASLARDGRQELERSIRERPWTSVACAAAAGLLLGVLLVRR